MSKATVKRKTKKYVPLNECGDEELLAITAVLRARGNTVGANALDLFRVRRSMEREAEAEFQKRRRP